MFCKFEGVPGEYLRATLSAPLRKIIQFSHALNVAFLVSFQLERIVLTAAVRRKSIRWLSSRECSSGAMKVKQNNMGHTRQILGIIQTTLGIKPCR